MNTSIKSIYTSLLSRRYQANVNQFLDTITISVTYPTGMGFTESYIIDYAVGYIAFNRGRFNFDPARHEP